MKKRIIKTNRKKRKMMLSIGLAVFLFLGIGYSTLSTNLNLNGNIKVKEHDYTMYGILRKAYNNNAASQYTLGSKDTMTGTHDKPVYYWKNLNDIENKINVIFGDKCWQLMRTTDTGGVKLLFNGNVENGKCLNTRGTHIGYNDSSVISMVSNAYYGTDYIYDPETSKFSLSGNLVQSNWNESTSSDLIGHYSCNSTSDTATCSTLYSMYAYSSPSSSSNNKTAAVLNITSAADYDSIGNLPLNYNVHLNGESLASVSYMFNEYYPDTRINMEGYMEISSMYSIFSYSSKTTITEDKWFADSVSYSNRYYALDSPYHVSTDVDPTTVIGKYFATSTNGLYTVSYIIGYDGERLITVTMSNGKTISDYEPIIVGDSYTDNGDGTYTLQNTNTLSFVEWYNDIYFGKYTCGINKTACEKPMRIVSTHDGTKFSYVGFQDSFTLGKGRNNLTLTDTITLSTFDLIANNTAYDEYKYLCKSGKAICENASDLIMAYQGYNEITTNDYYKDIKFIKNYTFGKSVTWDGTKYTLKDTVGMESYNNNSIISNHHFTCKDTSGTECENVTYLYYSMGSSFYSFELSNGKTGPDDIIYETLQHNVKDSVSKYGIEKWYEREMLEYDSYLEKAIFINSKYIKNRAGLNPNGSGDDIRDVIRFSSFNGSSSPIGSLYTNSNTEAYSVENSEARLKYSIGLPSYRELSLMPSTLRPNYPKILTASPWDYNNGERIILMNSTYTLSYYSAGQAARVRPVISLKPGTTYTSGTGSQEAPYIVDAPPINQP